MLFETVSFPDPAKCEGRQAIFPLHLGNGKIMEFRLVLDFYMVSGQDLAFNTLTCYQIPYWGKIYHKLITHIGYDEEDRPIYEYGEEVEVQNRG